MREALLPASPTDELLELCLAHSAENKEGIGSIITDCAVEAAGTGYLDAQAEVEGDGWVVCKRMANVCRSYQLAGSGHNNEVHMSAYEKSY